MKNYKTLATALWIALQSAACQSPTEVKPEPRPTPADTAVAVSSVSSLVPGQEAHIQGKNLTRLNSLTVDGVQVSFVATSDKEAVFTFPESAIAPCDVDGRDVAVVANGTAKATGELEIASTLSLKVGESRILTAKEIHCLQLPAGAEEYLLHVSDFRGEMGEAQKVFDLSTLGGNSGRLSGFSPSQSLLPGSGAHRSLGTRIPRAPMKSISAAQQVVVEPRLATAAVGDTLKFVDWTKTSTLTTSIEEADLFEAVVVAATPEHVIVVDTRYPEAKSFEGGARQKAVQQAADIVGRTAIPAIRAVMDPSFEVPQGAAGRTYSVISATLPYQGGAGAGADGFTKSFVPLSAEVMLTTLNGVEDMNAKSLASLIIHELGHGAENVMWEKRGMTEGGFQGWYAEALAEQVAETAARIALGAETGASIHEKRERADVPSGGHMDRWPSHRTDVSPWQQGSFGGVGPYDTGARLLLFARQKLGQMGFEIQGKTLHQMLIEKQRYDAQAIAEVLGMSVREMLEEAHLAELTDDLIAGPHSLPQIAGWNNTPQVAGDYSQLGAQGHLISRKDPIEKSVEVAAGNKQFWYIPGGAEQGVSVEAENVNLKNHHQVRITRLR